MTPTPPSPDDAPEILPPGLESSDSPWAESEESLQPTSGSHDGTGTGDETETDDDETDAEADAETETDGDDDETDAEADAEADAETRREQREHHRRVQARQRERDALEQKVLLAGALLGGLTVIAVLLALDLL